MNPKVNFCSHNNIAPATQIFDLLLTSEHHTSRSKSHSHTIDLERGRHPELVLLLSDKTNGLQL